MKLTFVVEPDKEDGGYVGKCREIAGLMSQGETVDEALQGLADAFSGWMKVNNERAQELAREQGWP